MPNALKDCPTALERNQNKESKMIPKFTRDAIYNKMRKQGITQTQLASELGFARQTLNAILNGKMSVDKHEQTILQWYKSK